MSKRFIGFRHTVGVLSLFYGGSLVTGGVDKFIRQFLHHATFVPGAGGLDQPSDRQGLTPFSPDFDRHLISRATNTAGPDFQRRLHVLHRRQEQG